MSTTNPITFDAMLFRAQCPEYCDVNKYPDALIEMYWDQAILIVSNVNYGALFGDARAFAINLLVAHLLYLSKGTAKGQTGGPVTSATVDKVSVTTLAPPVGSMFSYWLAGSPRGQELLALLEVSTAGGFYVGGLPEGRGFRKFGGVF